MPAQPSASEPVIRRTVPGDAPAVAALYSAARAAAVPQIPAPVHTPEEDVAFYTGRLQDPDVRAWVAEVDGEVVGFALSTPHSLDALYVRPGRTGRGIGSRLLDAVEQAHPDGYELWVFESNAGARRLYESRGLVVVERTDGEGNEEGAPDLRMRWRPGPGAGRVTRASAGPARSRRPTPPRPDPSSGRARR